MHSWQKLLQFLDCHPWFLPSIAAIITIAAALYALSRWVLRMIRAWWERRKEKQVIEYLATQLNPGPFVPDGYGHIPRRQKDCSVTEIARSLKKKPVKVLVILERLEQQHQVDHHGPYREWWCISNHELNGRE